MPQLPGYFPIRYQSGTQFAQSWTFTDPSGNALNVSGYSAWALTLYDTPGGNVKYASGLFTYANSGSPTPNIETASATAQPLAAAGTADYGYYELAAVTSGGQAPTALMHGPYIFEP